MSKDQGRISTPAFSAEGHFNSEAQLGSTKAIFAGEPVKRPVIERQVVQSPSTQRSFRAAEFARG